MKKRENSLRPLTEKEIQQRLYGAYHTESSTGIGREMKVELIEPSIFSSFPKRNALSGVVPTLEKASARVGSFLGKIFPIFLSFSRALVTKVASPWGGSVLLIVFLFLAIHSLNSFRAKAMKSPPSPASVTLRHKENQPNRTVAEESGGSERVERVTSPPLPQKESSFREVEKPYVIQLVTYAREEDAQRQADEIAQENLPAFVQPIQRSHGKTYYPVFLGRFETFREAQAKLGEFRKKPILKDFPDSFVRTL